MSNIKKSYFGIELIRLLASEGHRIFTIERAREFSARAGIKDAYLTEALYNLRRTGWIVPLHRGLYAISSTTPGIAPVHEFEIAMALIDPAAISHWSALHYHGLSDQSPRKVFVLTTTEVTIPRRSGAQKTVSAEGYSAGGMNYQFVPVKPERFFGTEKIWVGEARVTITDPERTLLDGLSMPQHCGDFAEVLHAFEKRYANLDLEKIIHYALRLDGATIKRLGWVLDQQGIDMSRLELLFQHPIKGYRKLDSTGPQQGPLNTRWMIQENTPGEDSVMKPLRTRLLEARERWGAPWEVVERDYLLTWILAGIGQVPSLRDSLVFKGGTALKKCYFGDYRFSEDLDFSAVGNVPKGDAMEQAINDVCAEAEKKLDDVAPIKIVCERYTEKEAHVGGQEAFIFRAQFPWHRQPSTRVMVETTMDETIYMPIVRRPVLHEYGEPVDDTIAVYALEEIVAEKLRAILQHRQKLEQRGWSRSRARDYYDLWRILGTYKTQMNLTDFPALLRSKCTVRHVDFQGAKDFFHESLLMHIERTWAQWLGTLVPGLPSFHTVIGELRPQIETLLSP